MSMARTRQKVEKKKKGKMTMKKKKITIWSLNLRKVTRMRPKMQIQHLR
jgi:hypothetical protein